MLADFNAAIGSETSALMPKIVESHTIGDETSRNGMLLSEWCLERKLRIEKKNPKTKQAKDRPPCRSMISEAPGTTAITHTLQCC